MTLVESHARATRSSPGETAATLGVTSGRLPDDLSGVLYRNGPARDGAFGVRYRHPFDGDGMVTRFAFEGGRVHYRNRFVRTRELIEEERAGRMLYRGFGTNLPGGLRANLLRLRFKNAANTSVVWHAGKLLALWEAGLPHHLDERTLETVGPFDYDGALVNRGGLIDRVLMPELPFSAHPKLDPHSGDLINFGLVNGRSPHLLVYRVSRQGVMQRPERIDLGHLLFVHDFAMTAAYLVFFLVPVAFDVPRTLLGLRPPADALGQVDGAPTRVLLVPRAGGAPRVIETDPCFVFHFAGAHDEGDRVVAHAFRFPRFPRFSYGEDPTRLDPPLLWRFSIDPSRGRVEASQLTTRPGELPGVDAGPTGRIRHVWAVGGRPGERGLLFGSIWKLDTQTGDEALLDMGDDLPGEPVFVPRRGATRQGDGYLLTLVYRASLDVSELVICDALSLEPVCSLRLPHHVPPGFHGTWVPAP